MARQYKHFQSKQREETLIKSLVPRPQSLAITNWGNEAVGKSTHEKSHLQANLAVVPVQRKLDMSSNRIEKEPSSQNQTGVPNDLKERLEQLSGMDMSDVRVHYNSVKPAQLNAYAYTQGNQIYVGPRQEHHLPHELWHTVQQKQGRVKLQRHPAKFPINDNAVLEDEANRKGVELQIRTPKKYSHSSAKDNEDPAPHVRRNIDILGNTPIQLKTWMKFAPPKVWQRPTMGPDGKIALSNTGEKTGAGVSAYLDPNYPIKGSGAGKTITPVMEYLDKNFPVARGWVRGHLLNARLGGLNVIENIAPITERMNTGGHVNVEAYVKKLVTAGIPVTYEVSHSVHWAPKDTTDWSEVTITPALHVQVTPDRNALWMKDWDTKIHPKMVTDRNESIMSTPIPSIASGQERLNDISQTQNHINVPIYMPGKDENSGRELDERGWGYMLGWTGRGESLKPEEVAAISGAIRANGMIWDSDSYAANPVIKARMDAHRSYKEITFWQSLIGISETTEPGAWHLVWQWVENGYERRRMELLHLMKESHIINYVYELAGPKVMNTYIELYANKVVSISKEAKESVRERTRQTYTLL